MTEPAELPFDEVPEPPLPARPYIQEGAPSAGYATGADTSKAAETGRAEAHAPVMRLLAERRWHGLTGHEASDALGVPKTTTGQAALSTLHKANRVMRLTEVRNRQKVYVLPEYVNGRPTELRGRHGPRSCPNCGVDL